MRTSAAIFALAPLLALAQPGKFVTRQEGPIEVPEGPLPACTNFCFGQWGWPITLCTGQEGLNHLIECFYEECEDEQRRIHAQLAAEQNCEDGMGWPTRMPDELEVEGAAPADDVEDDEEAAADSASSSTTSQGSATSSPSGVPTGGFAEENPSPSVSSVSSEVASATQSPNGARQTAYVGYAGVAAAAIGMVAVL